VTRAGLAAILAATVAAMPRRTPTPAATPASAAPQRRVAVTFDDLPGVSVAGDGTVKPLDAMTAKLVDAIAASGAPVVGFVNEGKLYADERLDPARVAALRRWTDAGFELGNHTRDHVDLNTTDPYAFEDQIVRGEPVTKELLAERGKRLRFFRHPYLHTGRDLATRDQVATFLAGRGYTVAPVTHDNSVGNIQSQRVSRRFRRLRFGITCGCIPIKVQSVVVVSIIRVTLPITRKADRVRQFFETSVVQEFSMKTKLHTFKHVLQELSVEQGTNLADGL